MMKAYTDLEQSKKLAEIIPFESADMFFQLGEDKYADSIRVPLTKEHWEQMMPNIKPCWSLVSLLDVLPDEFGDYHFLTLDKEGNEYCCCYKNANGNSFGNTFADNPVDACYEMIIKLKEQNLL